MGCAGQDSTMTREQEAKNTYYNLESKNIKRDYEIEEANQQLLDLIKKKKTKEKELNDYKQTLTPDLKKPGKDAELDMKVKDILALDRRIQEQQEKVDALRKLVNDARRRNHGLDLDLKQAELARDAKEATEATKKIGDNTSQFKEAVEVERNAKQKRDNVLNMLDAADNAMRGKSAESQAAETRKLYDTPSGAPAPNYYA